MAHHKRHRPKNRRGGCLFCKPHKCNGGKHRDPHSVLKLKERFSLRSERDIRNGFESPSKVVASKYIDIV